MRHLSGLAIALALGAGFAGATRSEAQTPGGGGALIAAFGGVGLGRGSPEGSGLLGAEVRLPIEGRFAGSLVVSRWWLAVGCDQLIGAPCDENAWSVDLGATFRLTPARWAWQLALAPRLGRFLYSADRGVWSYGLGIEASGALTGRVGWRVGTSYHALIDGHSSFETYPPMTGDQVIVQAGLQLRP